MVHTLIDAPVAWSFRGDCIGSVAQRGPMKSNPESRDSQVRNCAPWFDASHRPE